eukprot:gene5727-11574_t
MSGSCIPIQNPNNEQNRAIFAPTHKPLKVIACPGSGKTLALLERLKFILQNNQNDISSILVITFSRNSAQEIKHRLCDQSNTNISLQYNLRNVHIYTFHGVCLKIIKDNFSILGMMKKPLIASTNKSLAMLKEVLNDYSQFTLPTDMRESRKLLLNIHTKIQRIKASGNTPNTSKSTTLESSDENL